jgi:hypothetical protein
MLTFQIQQENNRIRRTFKILCSKNNNKNTTPQTQNYVTKSLLNNNSIKRQKNN